MVTAMASLGQWAQHHRALPILCPSEAHPDICHGPAGHRETEQSSWYNFSQCFPCPFSAFSQDLSWFPDALVAVARKKWWAGKSSGWGCGCIHCLRGHGGGLELTWMGRTKLCPRPGMMCFSYLIKQNVECKMQAKKWWKYCGREMEE